MAKRKSLNKRSSRFSRGSGGSNVLNSDTNVLDDEQPYWWRNLENNTIATPSFGSTNFNQTSRHLNPNSSIETNDDLDDGWWKVLEGTSGNLKCLQKANDLSKRDAKDGGSSMSESEEEVKIAKKKPHLRSEAKTVDGNAFLCALKDPKVMLIPLEKDISITQRYMLTTRMTEHSNDLMNSPLPKATSTPLERSTASQEISVGKSNSDTEPILKKIKPKIQLLRRHYNDMKKNLFENILTEDKSYEEGTAHRPSTNASAVMDKIAEQPESRIVKNESKLEGANKKLHPTEKAAHKDFVSNSSDTSHDFLEPAKPKSRFLRQTRRTPRENLFQKIFSDSDSSITTAISNRSQNRNSTRTKRVASVISTESNEDMNLRLSNSSNMSDIDIIGTDNKVSSSGNSHVEIARPQSEDRISNAVKTYRERSVLSNENKGDRNVPLLHQTQLYSNSDEEENDRASDVTLLTATSRSLSVRSKSITSSDIILQQQDIRETQQSQKNSIAVEKAVESLTKGSAKIKHPVVAETADDTSEIGFRDYNKLRKQSMSRSAQDNTVKESATSAPMMKSQEHSSSVNLHEDRTGSEAEPLDQTSPRRQSKRSTTAQQRISFTENDKQTPQQDKTTPRRSKRFKADQRMSETENIPTPGKDSRDAVKHGELRDFNRSQTRTRSRSAQETAMEKTAMSTSMIKSQEHSRSLNLHEDRTSSEAESSFRTSPRRQSKRLTTSQRRISFTETDEDTHEVDNTMPRRSNKFQAAQRTSETENVRTPGKNSRDAVKHGELRDFNRSQERTTLRSAQEIAIEKTAMSTSMVKSQEHSRSPNLHEDRTSSEAESSFGTFPRRQSKRLTTSQRRVSFTETDEDTHEDDTTLRRSNRFKAAQRTSETENVRTPEKNSRVAVKHSEFVDFIRPQERTILRSAQKIAMEKTAMSTSMVKSQEHSRSLNLHEDRTSSEAESSYRTSPRRQSKRLTTSQRRISFTETDEDTHEVDKTTPRRSNRFEVAQRTSETENVRTPEKNSRVAVKHSEFVDFIRPQERTILRSAQKIAMEKTAMSTSMVKSQEHSRSLNLHEDRTSSEAESSYRTSPRRQSKRLTTSQRRISFTETDEDTHEVDKTTPRRSNRFEVAQRTSETENVRTPEKNSRVAVKHSEFVDFIRPQERTILRSAQKIAMEKTAMSTSMIKSQEHSRSLNLHEDRTSSEAVSSYRTSPRRQSKRLTTSQRRISFTETDEDTHEVDNTTSRRSNRFEVAQRTSDTENLRTPGKNSSDAVKNSEFRDFNRSQRRTISGSAQDNTVKESATSAPMMKSQEHSSSVNLNKDSTSFVAERSGRTSPSRQSKRSTTVQQQISFTETDEQTHEVSITTPTRSKRFEGARRTSETENVRSPERESEDDLNDSELEGTLQSQRSRQYLLETQETTPLYKSGSSKARSSTAPQKSQKVLEDFFKTDANTIPASQALSNPKTAQEIRKKLDEMKQRELQEIEKIGKLPVVQKKNKFSKGLRPQPKKNSVPKKIDKAYLVNGMVYKRPRLPRPKKWVTDLLYRYLWKKMEPKYKLETRVQSEKFVSRLCDMCDVIAKRKTYSTYVNELHALMKEMARLQIIRTRHDFYIFCQDFLPYELRVKMVPILLPGNQRTIPYDPNKLHKPLIASPRSP